MSKYYGVTTPTDDFIAHWGVKGMKWGIRKARPVGNGAPKSLGYRRAEKKLAKLEAKANRNALLAKADRLDKVSKGARIAGRVGLGAAAAGTAGSIGSGHLVSRAIGKANSQRDTVRNSMTRQYNLALSGHNKHGITTDKTLAEWRKYNNEIDSAYTKSINNADKLRNISRSAQAAGAGLAALGYGAAIGSKLRANALRKTANNSAKMAAARQRAAEFRKQMNAKYGVQNRSKKRK